MLLSGSPASTTGDQSLQDEDIRASPGLLLNIVEALQASSSFLLRLFCQVMFLCFVSESVLDFNKITACFEQVIKDNHKTSFEQWFFDLSYKSSVAVAVFTMGLFFSLSIPMLTPLVLVLMTIQLYVDKYNLMYIYPLEFESQTISRKALVKNSFFAIILF